MDHKNNLYTEALLDNRRVSKKMSNWALELQGFNIIRIWIRGEANILRDAPSRAPWENALADQLPIPDAPLCEIIAKICRQPPEFEREVQTVALKRKLPKEWVPLQAEVVGETDQYDDLKDQAPTPQFGTTPRFGDAREEAVNRAREIDPTRIGSELEAVLADELGPGTCFHESGPIWPVWPRYAMADYVSEPACPAAVVPDYPVPVNRLDNPVVLERIKDARGHNFVISMAEADCVYQW